MSRSTAKVLSILCTIAAVVICYLLILLENKGAATAVIIFYIPIAIVLNYFQRCKKCGRWPKRGDLLNDHCPRCGAPLDD